MPSGSFVDVKFRNGDIHKHEQAWGELSAYDVEHDQSSYAGGAFWKHHGHISDIVEYRLSSAEKPIEASATFPGEYIYFSREIGESDWEECTKEQYEYANKQPQLDTKKEPVKKIIGKDFGASKTKAIPENVYNALLMWSGCEPSQSVLALAVDEWRAKVAAGVIHE